MSEENGAGQDERQGSRLAKMFGYVNAEDRGKWMQDRAQNKPRVNALKKSLKLGLGSMMEFGQQVTSAKLNAATRVAADVEFQRSHNKTTSRHRDPRTRSIIETVDYEPRDDREGIDLDLEP